MRRFSVLVFFSCITFFLPGSRVRASEQDDLEALRRKWAVGPLDKIRSATFKVNYFRIQDGSSKRISTERMHEFLTQAKLEWEADNNPEHIINLSKSLPLSPGYLPQQWMNGTIVVRGTDARNSFNTDLVPGAILDPQDISYLDGVEVDYLGLSKQASVFERKSVWRIFTIADLYCPPPIGDHLQVAGQDARILRVRDRDKHYEIDKISGCVALAYYAEGGVAGERWQGGFAEYVGGDGTKCTLPTFIASIEYVDNYVTNCFLFIIKSIEYNYKVESFEFYVPIPAGTTVLLFGANEQKNPVSSTRIKANVNNAFSLMAKLHERASFGRQHAKKRATVVGRNPTSRKRFLWILGANLALVCLLALGQFFRNRRSPAK